jgi:pimeloyl-ACP methyl ester carboxylesterase
MYTELFGIDMVSSSKDWIKVTKRAPINIQKDIKGCAGILLRFRVRSANQLNESNERKKAGVVFFRYRTSHGSYDRPLKGVNYSVRNNAHYWYFSGNSTSQESNIIERRVVLPKESEIIAVDISIAPWQSEELYVDDQTLTLECANVSPRFDSIENDGKNLPYLFVPALNRMETAPILLCFHGWTGNSLPSEEDAAVQYGDAHWNILVPVDRYGFNRQGSWWLGENGNFFLIKLIEEMLVTVRKEYNLEGDLFVYGSSMGGFGALVHGLINEAKGFVLNVPQVRLLDSTFGKNKARFMDVVFGKDKLSDNNVNKLASSEFENFAKTGDATMLLNLIKSPDLPRFFLIQTRHDESDGDDGISYVKEHALYLTEKLLERKLPFELHIVDEEGHSIIWTRRDALSLLDKTAKLIS